MGRAALVSLLLAAPAPGPSTFRKVATDAQPSLVRLTCGTREASGVIIGGAGELLTTSKLCDGDTVIAVLDDAKVLEARRIRADDALGLLLLQLPAGTYRAVSAGKRAPQPGEWVVGVAAGAQGLQPAAGMWHGKDPRSAQHGLSDTPTLQGAGIFSLDGRLVGLAVQPAPNHRMRVVPIDAIRPWLAKATP